MKRPRTSFPTHRRKAESKRSLVASAKSWLTARFASIALRQAPSTLRCCGTIPISKTVAKKLKAQSESQTILHPRSSISRPTRPGLSPERLWWSTVAGSTFSDTEGLNSHGKVHVHYRHRKQLSDDQTPRRNYKAHRRNGEVRPLPAMAGGLPAGQ